MITYNARGYPPSDVPEPVDAYSQEQATDDIAGLMRHLGIAQAHLVGLSMGGYAVLHFGLRYPTLARSLVVAGCGYGSVASERQRFQQDLERGSTFRTRWDARRGRRVRQGPTRVQFEDKDPRGWREFADQLAEHSNIGAARTMQGCKGDGLPCTSWKSNSGAYESPRSL